MKKEGLPIVVFKQGGYIVAFPMNLKQGEVQIGDKALESLMQSDNLGTGVLELNNTLANNGLSPSKYNLFYLGEDNQSLFTEDKMTKSLEDAINENTRAIFIEHIRHSDRMNMDSRSSRIFGHGPMRRNTSPDKRRFP